MRVVRPVECEKGNGIFGQTRHASKSARDILSIWAARGQPETLLTHGCSRQAPAPEGNPVEWIYPFLLLVLPLGGPLLCVMASRRGGGAAYAVALGVLGIVATASLVAVLRAPFLENTEMLVFGWGDSGAFLRLDGLGTILALVGSGICLASVVVSRAFGALKEHGVRYLSSLLVLCSALNGIFLAGDLLLFAIFWELMVVSSYFLIVHHGGGEAVAAGRKYFVFTQAGAVLLIVAVMIAFQQTGTTRMVSGLFFASSSAFAVFAFLAFVAFAIDAAIVPLHTWLPDAHSESPTPMSALLSGIVVKTGIYGIIRFFFLTYGFPPGWPDVVIPLGLVTAYVGGFLALFQMDGKRLIAFSTVSQMGLIAMGLGSGVAIGAAGAVLHILGHSLYKSLLFLSAGWVMASSHTRDLRQASVRPKGIWPSFVVGVLSISGVPFLSGFAGKALIAKSIAPGFPTVSALSSLVGMFTFLAFVKLGWFLFVRKNAVNRSVDTPHSILVVTGVLASLCVLLGVLAPLVTPVLGARLGLNDLSTRVPSPLQATTSNLLGYGSLAIALLIWSRKQPVYRLFTTGPLGPVGRLAERELHFDDLLSLASRGVTRASHLSAMVATGNARDYMVYLVLAWLAGALLLGVGLV
jgi:formate hydrogenlyase subunit 3/multisubunit Na+/H+ antiporter MnhD subunit